MSVAGRFSLVEQDSPVIEVEKPDGTVASIDLWEFYDFCMKFKGDGMIDEISKWLEAKLGIPVMFHRAMRLYYFAMEKVDEIVAAEEKIDDEKKDQSSTAS